MITAPKEYSLNSRTILESVSDNKIGIVKLIKSRIIQKDAKKIIEIKDKITSVNPSLDVALICSENICSKSKALLADNNIDIIYREL